LSGLLNVLDGVVDTPGRVVAARQRKWWVFLVPQDAPIFQAMKRVLKNPPVNTCKDHLTSGGFSISQKMDANHQKSEAADGCFLGGLGRVCFFFGKPPALPNSSNLIKDSWEKIGVAKVPLNSCWSQIPHNGKQMTYR